MDDDEFMKTWTALGEEVEKKKEKLREFSAEHQRRSSEAAAREKLANMSDAERAALAQIAKAEGIESQESVHNG